MTTNFHKIMSTNFCLNERFLFTNLIWQRGCFFFVQETIYKLIKWLPLRTKNKFLAICVEETWALRQQFRTVIINIFGLSIYFISLLIMEYYILLRRLLSHLKSLHIFFKLLEGLTRFDLKVLFKHYKFLLLKLTLKGLIFKNLNFFNANTYGFFFFLRCQKL